MPANLCWSGTTECCKGLILGKDRQEGWNHKGSDVQETRKTRIVYERSFPDLLFYLCAARGWSKTNWFLVSSFQSLRAQNTRVALAKSSNSTPHPAPRAHPFARQHHQFLRRCACAGSLADTTWACRFHAFKTYWQAEQSRTPGPRVDPISVDENRMGLLFQKKTN